MSQETPTPSGTALSFDTVVELLGLLDGSDFPTTIDFRDGSLRLKIQRGTHGGSSAAPGAARSAPVAAPTAPATPAAPVAAATVAAPTPEEGAGEAVEAPIAGVFYRASNPDAEPFVEVGQVVGADDVVGIVEVMKLMNTVRAGIAGTVVDVCVGDAELVEFGQTLVRIEPGA